MTGPAPQRRPRIRIRRLVLAALLPLAAISIVVVARDQASMFRTTPVYNPPVLAGQRANPWCTGGFYARRGDDIVLTMAAHCGIEGDAVTGADGGPIVGVMGPRATFTPCPHPGKQCLASDMMLMVVDPAAIPWGHLNEVDMGAGGYRVIAPGTRPLACDDIGLGDAVEIDGRERFRTGNVIEKGPNLNEVDPQYFPCMLAADIRVQSGDSGGAVLVNGLPGGITSRQYGVYLGFTPLAEGLEQLGLDLCTEPDCGLVPPG